MSRGDRSRNAQQSRRSYLKYAGAVAAVGGLAGCGGDGGDGSGTPSGTTMDPGQTTDQDPSTDQGTTTDPGEWPDLSGQEVHFLTDEANEFMQDLYDRVKADFEEATGATVNNEYGSLGQGVQERLVQLLQAGDPPEVMITSHKDGGSIVNTGVAHPVNDALDRISERYGEPDQSALFSVDGNQFLIPMNAAINTFYYREDINSDRPSTWDEFLAWVEEAHGTDGIAGYKPAMGETGASNYFILQWAWTNGATMCERVDGEVQVTMADGENRERWIEALEYIKELNQYSSSGATNYTDYIQTIAREDVAATIYPGARPKFQSIIQEKPFIDSIRVAPPPSNTQQISVGSAEGFMTFNGADTEAASVYMDFFMQPEYYLDFLVNSPFNRIPLWDGIQEQFSERVREEVHESWTDSDIEAITTVSENYRTLSNETDPANLFNAALWGSLELGTLSFNILEQGNDVVDELEAADERLSNVLSQAK